MKPYVGVTGPSSNEEVRQICEEFSSVGYTMESDHLPMLGFLVSYKTLNGKETKNLRYPLTKNIPGLLDKTNGQVFTMLHYNSRERNTLSDQINKLFEGIYKSGLCKALQLNIVWPNVDQIKRIKDKFPEMKIVFQASGSAMRKKSSQEVAEGIEAYGNSIDYVLIDPSGGSGRPFRLDNFLGTFREINSTSPHLSLGFAGGFDGKNVSSRVKEIIDKTGSNSFSIDAEGGLRDKISEAYGNDLLNMKKVGDYLRSVSTVLK